MIAILEAEAVSMRQFSLGCGAVILILTALVALLSLAQVMAFDPVGVLLVGALLTVVVLVTNIYRAAVCRADIRGGVYRRIQGRSPFERRRATKAR
jgi:hypothetical protein